MSTESRHGLLSWWDAAEHWPVLGDGVAWEWGHEVWEVIRAVKENGLSLAWAIKLRQIPPGRRLVMTGDALHVVSNRRDRVTIGGGASFFGWRTDTFSTEAAAREEVARREMLDLVAAAYEAAT